LSPWIERSKTPVRSCFLVLLVLLAILSPAYAQTQKVNEAYTAKIREFTTDPHFNTKYMDSLPFAPNVPTPLDVLGHIVGAPDVLSYTHEIYKYMRALDAASPRVKVFTKGTSEEGREMILVVISDEATIESLDKYTEMLRKLADPRKITEAEAEMLIRTAKPAYYATGGLHSGETGAPEMLMELAYRIAVDESEFMKAIRKNAIILITPVTEVDGRDKVVDLAMAKRKDPKSSFPRSAIYTGKYVGHDNNRDNMGLTLALDRNLLRIFNEFCPQVTHDLHESASFLYISTGRGPYNAWLDPITIDEWHQIAYEEVGAMTKLDVPGVWLHDYYDGWAPNYGMSIANFRNSIGRFYETQGAGDGSTTVITTRSGRTWYRPNSPTERALWSIRNNVNLQGSAIQIAMHYVATNKEKFLRNFYLKGKRSVAKPVNEGPAAYVFPADDPRPGQSARLLQLFRQQGIEVHKASEAFTAKVRDPKTTKDVDVQIPAGSHIIRMDQPYSRLVDTFLDVQYFNVADRPYDDVGWTLGPLYNARTLRVEDAAVLKVAMSEVKDITLVGSVAKPGNGPSQAYIINHNADNVLASFRFKNKNLKIHVAEKPFDVAGKSFAAGSFILKTTDNAGDLEGLLAEATKQYGLRVHGSATTPDVPTHEIVVPRVALVHDWQSTQSEGWVRIAFEETGVPYDYVSVHEIRDNARLRDKYDVLLFGPMSANAMSIVNGVAGDKPIAWKKTDLTPNIGRQASTDDIRGGIEIEGVLHLRDFVKSGGLLLTLTSSSSLPIHFGFAQGMGIKSTPNLVARGGVYKADVIDRLSPIAYGYDEKLGVFFNSSPVFSVSPVGPAGPGGGAGPAVTTERGSGRGDKTDPDVAQGRPRDIGLKALEAFEAARKAKGETTTPAAGSALPSPRVVLRYAEDASELVISGGISGGADMAGTPAVVDCRYGEGHVVMFSMNPMWRHQTLGSFFLVYNAMMNYNKLDAGK
jgi:hypothetical protein